MHTAPKTRNDDFTDTDWKAIAQGRGKTVMAQIDTIDALKEHLGRTLHKLVACEKYAADREHYTIFAHWPEPGPDGKCTNEIHQWVKELAAERDTPDPDVDTDS
ncbi:MAG TPA: hypothetical protein VNJ04_19555 [Gemmatimonadaceae bacterium]|nr:hypothetical protein [Gemmatimonadaceae bacterium]